jgi:twitching motility protein PilT
MIITAMLQSGDGISDLLFSPGRPPQVERHGELAAVAVPDIGTLEPDQTSRVARELIAGNEHALRTLKENGACDLSYSMPNTARFRVNVFRQRGSFAIVMRVIATKIPTLTELNLPTSLEQVATLKNGIVLVTGPTGSGKSTTLAAIINLINETRAEHILTIEDPIEFLYLHKKGTVHQRELHSDTPTFALALRAALRQAPKVILVGEAEGPQHHRVDDSVDGRDGADGQARDGHGGELEESGAVVADVQVGEAQHVRVRGDRRDAEAAVDRRNRGPGPGMRVAE